MKECETPACNSTNLVYSGVDAFVIAGGGAPTERFCYTCLSAYAHIREAVGV